MAQPGTIDTRELARLRRDLKRVAPEVGKELDNELRSAAAQIAVIAASLTARKTGKLAGSWSPSITGRHGVAVRNRQVYAAAHEYGGKRWLRRGLPYRDSDGQPPSSVGNGLPVRQVSLGGGRVQNEAQYLIKRSRPGGRAAVQQIPRSIARIEAAANRATQRALS